MDERLILDLGCGGKKRPGVLGVDLNARTNPDILHDLNKFPYPFEDATVDHVIMDNVLEHLSNAIAVMEELYRILKTGGTAQIIVPYFRSNWAAVDPTHIHSFTTQSFAYYDPDHDIFKRYRYTDAKFKTERVVFNETILGGLVRPLVKKFANRWPWRYEYHFSHLFPLDDITWFLLEK